MGSSSSSRSGSPASARAERGTGQLATREGGERAVEIGVAEAEPAQRRCGPVAPVPAARVLEPCLGLAVAAQRRRVVRRPRHRLLERPQLLLDRDEVGGARERVLAQRQPAVARRPLVVQRDPCSLRERELAALQRGLADDRAQQCRLAGAVRPGERKRGRAGRRVNETPSNSGSPESSLRRFEAISTAMAHPRVDAAVTARPRAPTFMLDDSETRSRARRTIDTIRALAMDAVQKANAGHPGTAMALAPLAYLLYRDVMRHNPADPHWPGRDRFILSAGHACILQYASLHLAGYDVTLDDLQQFRQWGSRTPGHPEPGTRPASRRRRGRSARASPTASEWRSRSGSSPSATTGRTTQIVDSLRSTRICSDGDLMEGVSRRRPRSRATSGSARSSTSTTTTTSRSTARRRSRFTTEDKGKRFEAYGWHVQHVGDAEDLDALLAALAAAKAEEERPSLIVLRSHIGVPGAARDRHGEGARRSARRAPRCGRPRSAWASTPTRTFVVADDGARAHGAGVGERGAELRGASGRRGFAAWADAFPELARRAGARPRAGAARRDGARRCRSSRPARTLPPAMPARR